MQKHHVFLSGIVSGIFAGFLGGIFMTVLVVGPTDKLLEQRIKSRTLYEVQQRYQAEYYPLTAGERKKMNCIILNNCSYD